MLSACLLLLSLSMGVAWVGGPASKVLGQNDSFFSSDLNFPSGLPSATSFWFPAGLQFDEEGNLFVSDLGNNRIVRWPPALTQADKVWGQPNTSSFGSLDPPTRASLTRPVLFVLRPGGLMYAPDQDNHRALLFNISSASASDALDVWGQEDFVSRVFSATDHNFREPQCVSFNGAGFMFISDTQNHRVLGFAPDPSTGLPSKNASIVIGQVDYTSGAPNRGNPTPSADSLFEPISVVFDASDGMFVADSQNHRILYFLAGSLVSTRVYGTKNAFDVGRPNAGGTVSPWTFNLPAVIVLAQGAMYVADHENRRVVVYAPPTAEEAIGVYGQKDLFSSVDTCTQSGMNRSGMVAFDSLRNLYITDPENNRILIWAADTVPTFLSSSSIPPVVNGPAVIPAHAVSTIDSATLINGTLTIEGTLIIGPGATVTASSIFCSGVLNIYQNTVLISLGIFSVRPGSTLVITVAERPTSSSLSVLVAQFESFGGGLPSSSSSVASFSGSECFVLGNPVLTMASTTVTATISVMQRCGGGALSTSSIIAIVASVLGVAIVASILGVVIIRYQRARTLSLLKERMAAQTYHETAL